MPENLITFNVRKVPARIATKLTKMAAKSGIKRERYIRKLFELHVTQAARAPKTPGKYVLEAPTPAEVVAALEAERQADGVAVDDLVEQLEA